MTYTPNADFNGSDSFTFTVNDGTVDSDEATVEITVDAVNDPPEADSGTAKTDQDTPVTITLTGSDVDGDALTFAIATSPANGNLVPSRRSTTPLPRSPTRPMPALTIPTVSHSPSTMEPSTPMKLQSR